MRSAKYSPFVVILAIFSSDSAAATRDTLTSSRTKLAKERNVEVGVPYNQSDRELDGISTTRPKLGKERNVQVGVPYDKVDREIDRNKVGDKNLYRRAQKKEEAESEWSAEDSAGILGIKIDAAAIE